MPLHARQPTAQLDHRVGKVPQFTYSVSVSEADERRPRLRVIDGGNGRSEEASTDAQLLRDVRALDPRVARVVYRRLRPVVDRTLFRVFGGREQDHEDLVQASFEQIFESLLEGRFQGNCALTTWAATISARVGLAELRKRYVRRAVYSDKPEADAETLVASERRQRAREELDLVRRALAALPEDRAWLLFMHDVEGHELTEIAEDIGASVSAVQSRVLRARKQFLERFEQLDAEARRISKEAT